MKRFLFACLLLLTFCTPVAAPSSTPQVIKIHATPATQPWLSDAYNCADGLPVILADVNDPKDADVNIRLDEPGQLPSPAYQIGQDDLLVVTHRDSQLQNLTTEEVRNLFSGPNNQEIEVWVFAPAEDIQQVFAREVLNDQPVTSLARLALSPQQMSDTLRQDKNAVGILPGKWMTGSMREIFSIPNLPVLAIVNNEPQGLLKSFLACLQKQKESTP